MASVREAHLCHAWLALVAVAAVVAGCGGRGLADNEQLFIVDAEGSHRRQLTHGDLAHTTPSWSPDGRRLAFLSTTCGVVSLEVVERTGDHVATLLRRRTCIGDAGVAWSPRGDAVAFLSRLEDRASTVHVDVVAPDGTDERRLATFSSPRDTEQGPVWAPDGTRVAYADGALDLHVVDLQGRVWNIADGAGDPRWSPRSGRILFAREAGPSVLAFFTVSPRGGPVARLPGRWIDAWAEWSPDATKVAVAGVPAAADGRYRLYVVDVRSGALRQVARAPDPDRPAWTSDGRRIAFATQDGRIAAVAPTGGPVETLVDLGDADIGDLAWSPNGKWLVFSAAKPPPED